MPRPSPQTPNKESYPPHSTSHQMPRPSPQTPNKESNQPHSTSH